jgi:hypothetical protein
MAFRKQLELKEKYSILLIRYQLLSEKQSRLGTSRFQKLAAI